MTEREVEEYLEEIAHLGISPGLGSIRELCGRLGDPQRTLTFVHIAGTNGKGSAAAYIASALACGGYRVGKYTSPALSGIRDLIQVNGRPIGRKALCRGMERVREACEAMAAEGSAHPTPFEVETALAFLYFLEKKCDIVVLEAGMGGLLDATNLVEHTAVAVFASISMDHMKFLGSTLGEIAGQKAGILKAGCAAVTVRQEPEVMEVLAREAAALGCPLAVADAGKAERVHYGLERQWFDYGRWKKLEISLAGQYQIDNAILALEALEALGSRGYPVAEEKLREGFLGARWPGRFTVAARKPFFIVDGAHNEDAAKRLRESVEFYFTGRRIIYIMGVFRDKDYGKIIELTQDLAAHIITVAAPGNPRALSAYQLAQEAARVHPNVTAADSLEEAVEMSYLLAGKDDVIIAFGSLSFLGRLMEIVKARTVRGKGPGTVLEWKGSDRK